MGEFKGRGNCGHMWKHQSQKISMNKIQLTLEQWGFLTAWVYLHMDFFSPNTYYSTTESHSWLNLWSQNQRFGRLTVELYADFLQKGGSAPLTLPHSTPTHVVQGSTVHPFFVLRSKYTGESSQHPSAGRGIVSK